MWQNQTKNISDKTRLLVYYTSENPKVSDTFWAFKTEDDQDKAIDNMVKRILQKKLFGKYRIAIFYQYGIEVKRFVNGIEVKVN